MRRTKNKDKADAILCSDFHLRETVPECRTDDFWETQWQKVMFVNRLQREHDCPVLHAGDLFHHWKPSPYLLSETMTFLPDQFHTIYGQHDLPQHNWDNRHKSGIFALEKAGVLTVLDHCHWGETPSDRSTYFVEHDRVGLVWHHMVWQGKRLWPGQTDPSGIAILKKYKDYDIILTGDNHKSFVESHEGRILVNPGSLMRQSADQIDFQPRVYLYYAATNTVKPVHVPIERDAVSRAHIERTQERDERIGAFIEKIEGDWDSGLDFKANLEAFFQKKRVRQSVKDKIYNAMDS